LDSDVIEIRGDGRANIGERIEARDSISVGIFHRYRDSLSTTVILRRLPARDHRQFTLAWQYGIHTGFNPSIALPAFVVPGNINACFEHQSINANTLLCRGIINSINYKK